MSIRLTMTAAAVLLSVGCAQAADDTQQSPTANPGSSGRPSAVLSQSECQSLWDQALNKSGSAMSSSGAASESSEGTSPGSSDSNMTSSGAGSESSSPKMGAAEQNQGELSKDQATRYIANFAMVDKNSDGQISKTEFQDGCKNGLVQTASRSETDAGHGKSSSY